MKSLIQDICKDKIVTLRNERQGIETAKKRYYPTGTFGYAYCDLALAIIDLKITIWQEFMGEE